MEEKEPVMALGIPMTPTYPFFFYGNGIQKGSSSKRYEIVDIAPTIANLLQIEAPNSTSGKVISEALEK